MKEGSLFRCGAFAAAAALLLGAGLAVQSVPARADTYNVCGVKSEGLSKKLKDGKALVVQGFLEIDQEGTEAFITLRNEDGSCEVILEADPGETKQALKCGNGADVTIIGAYKDDYLPAVDPATISCN